MTPAPSFPSRQIELVGGLCDGAKVWIPPGLDRFRVSRCRAGRAAPGRQELVYRDTGRLNGGGAAVFALEAG